MSRRPQRTRPLTILHEDERCLVVAKPPGLLTVQPPKSERKAGEDDLIARLAREGQRVIAVHRLDRETSGVVLLAKDQEARTALMESFRQHAVRKSYLAYVLGRPEPRKGRWTWPIKDLGASAIIATDGAPATTEYAVRECFAGVSLISANPVTGRHNQIRLHAVRAGVPLVGERKYARGRDQALRHKRAALHAAAIAFPSPAGTWVEVEAPEPLDLNNLRARLTPLES